jgi:hypothetical protein
VPPAFARNDAYRRNGNPLAKSNELSAKKAGKGLRV